MGATRFTELRERPALPREFLELHRRARFAAAAAEISHELGTARVTVGVICRVSSAAQSTFYDLFRNSEECLHHAVAEASLRLFEPLRTPPAGDWLAALASTLTDFYASVDAEPQLAELLLVHSLSLSPHPGGRGIEDGVTALSALLAEGRGAAQARGPRAAPLSEEVLARTAIAAARLSLGTAMPGDRAKQVRSMIYLAGELFLGDEGIDRANALAQAK